MADSGKKALMIGGLNIDMLGIPADAFRPGDSLPGRVRLKVGGVGFNIASRLAESGFRVSLITAFGNDQFAGMALEACRAKEIDISLSLRADCSSPTYMAIHAADGSLLSAINDMQALEALTAEYFLRHQRALPSGFAISVLDGNLPEESLKTLVGILPPPILADPVSCEKGLRMLPVLDRLKAIKPNALEALAMSGCRDVPDSAQWFLDQGVEQVYISMGPDGLYYADKSERGHIPVRVAIRVPTTGAGDAMTAGLAPGIASNLAVSDIARSGIDAANRYLLNQQKESKP